MSNLEIYAPLVNGDVYPMHENGEACSLFVTNFLGDDLRPPPNSITIKIETKSGKHVRIVIPNNSTEAAVFVDDEEL